MSSEPDGTHLAGRCLFCSLGCQLHLEEYAPQRWRPVMGDDTGRLCARGQMLADLVHQPRRVYRPAGRAESASLTDVIRKMARGLHREGAAGSRLVVWLDGNLAGEDLAATHRLCAALGGRARLLVHLPPHELGAVEGLDAAGVPQANPQDWQHADAFLIVGNPLATHPPTAPYLLPWARSRPDAPCVVVDSSAGVSGSYTSQRLVCRPGYEYWVVAGMVISAGLQGTTEWLPKHALLERVLEDSGVDLERLNRAAGQLRSAHRPAVIVAPATGGADRWRALVAVAATWAAQRDGLASVLTQSANAIAVSRYMRRHGLNSWAAACTEDIGTDIELLLVVGWDPSSGYPSAYWQPIAQQARQVVMASAFPPADTHWLDWLIPLALNVETSGTYIFADGRTSRVKPILLPPSGAPSVRGLMALFAQCWGELEGGASLSPADAGALREEDIAPVPLSSGPLVPAPPAAEETRAQLAVLVADPTQYFDGQTTRHSRWSRQLDPVPELWVPPGDARALGLRDGAPARIKNNQGEVKVRVVVAKDQPESGGCFAQPGLQGRPAGRWAVNGCFAEVRQLADWRFDLPNESAQAGTIDISVEPAKGAQELSH